MGRKGKSGMSSGGGGQVSPTSTGGKMVQQSPNQQYGENDNGSYAVINDSGKSEMNFYKYGNEQIYEVDRGLSDAERNLPGVDNPPRLYAFTKTEAMQYAKGWLKANKGK